MAVLHQPYIKRKYGIVNFYLTHRQNHFDPVHVDNKLY